MKRSWRSGFIAVVCAASMACSSSQSTTGTEGTNTSAGGASPAPTASASPEPASPAPTEASASPEPTASASPEPAIELPPMPTNLHGPTTPWARMNDRQRATYMQNSVLPAFRELLRAYDSTEYANVTCATCHGANARQVHFHMPNSLPVLPRFGTPEAQSYMAEHRRMYAFMGQRVVPAMATLLGTEPFNMETHQGFGCAGCHPHDAPSASPAPATRAH